MTARRFSVICVLLAGLGLGACDTAPQAALGALPAGMARIYVYRDAACYDGFEWTAVSLNGAVVGSSAPGAVFYRDVAPGTYRIEARSDQLYPEQAKTVAVAPGTTTFVKIQVQPFWGNSGRQWVHHTYVVAIVDPAIGQIQVGSLRLTPG